MYVDGFNFYYAVKHSRQRIPIYLGWCDFSKLGMEIVADRGDLATIKYFTAPVAEYGRAGGELGGEQGRQAVWLQAVRTIPRLTVIHGFHSGERSPDIEVKRKSRSEKQTDVNIAVALVRDAAKEEYDSAILITGDADQIPAVRVATKDFGRKVEVWLPPGHGLGRWSEFQRFRNIRISQLTPEMLARNRLPDVIRRRGEELQIPASWRAPANPLAT
jgi:uncharacterized LabA/DUF88 family protein